MSNVNVTTFTIVVVLFIVVTGVGFAAVRWRRTEDMLHLNEWGLGGRGFGTFISWFMLGGDVYTAYTYIAVPAVIFGSGSIGFFAVSYTIMVYPIIIIFLPRLWSVCRVHNYITPADFIRGRYGSRGLSLAAAFTGILSLMPYIALQLVGIQAVLTVMGVGTSSNNTFVKDLPLFIAFLVLAIFTYVSGLRAPAAISFIKDTLVYVMVIVAVFYIPTRLGGWGHIFGTAQTHFTAINPVTKKPNGTFVPTSKATGSTQLDFATLALGSAVALFLYPHTITGTLASKRRYVVKRNTALLPIYSVLLGLIALLGYMAITDKTTVANVKKAGDNAQLAVPYLFQHMRAGSPGSPSPRSSSARWYPPRSWPSPPRTCSPATYSPNSSSPTPAPGCRQGSRSGPRWWSSSARCTSRSSCRIRSPSTCNCSAGCGSCSWTRCSSAACSPAGSTAMPCCSAGWPGWPSAPSRPISRPRPPRRTGRRRPTSSSGTRSTSASPR